MRLVNNGGRIQRDENNAVLAEIPTHRIMGGAYKFGSLAGYLPLLIMVTFQPSNGDQKTHVQIECELTRIRRKFQLVSFTLSGIVLALLLLTSPEVGADRFLVLVFPFAAFEITFLSFRLYLPARLRKLFEDVTL